MSMLKLINEMRKNLIRREIGNEPELRDIYRPKILDNGAGEYGSWDYESFQNIISCDINTRIDCQKLPYKIGEFDIIVFSGVIQYIENPRKALKECYRVLAKHGILIIATINYDSIVKKIMGWKDELHKWTLKGFQKLIESEGFQIKKQKMIDFPFIPNKYKMVIYLKCQKT